MVSSRDSRYETRSLGVREALCRLNNCCLSFAAILPVASLEPVMHVGEGVAYRVPHGYLTPHLLSLRRLR